MNEFPRLPRHTPGPELPKCGKPERFLHARFAVWFAIVFLLSLGLVKLGPKEARQSVVYGACGTLTLLWCAWSRAMDRRRKIEAIWDCHDDHVDIAIRSLKDRVGKRYIPVTRILQAEDKNGLQETTVIFLDGNQERAMVVPSANVVRFYGYQPAVLFRNPEFEAIERNGRTVIELRSLGDSVYLFDPQIQGPSFGPRTKTMVAARQTVTANWGDARRSLRRLHALMSRDDEFEQATLGELIDVVLAKDDISPELRERLTALKPRLVTMLLTGAEAECAPVLNEFSHELNVLAAEAAAVVEGEGLVTLRG